MRALLLLVAAVAACAGTPAPQAGSARGERLYRSKCAACHRAYPPASRGRAEWAAVLEKMAPRSKLTPEEREIVLGYLQANARDARPPAAGP